MDSPNTTSLLLVSLDKHFADRLAQELATLGRICGSCAPADLQATNKCPDAIVSIVDYTNREQLLEAQSFAKSRELPMLSVEVEFDSVGIGPYIKPAESGCAQCHLIWSRSEWSDNHRHQGNGSGVLPSSCRHHTPIIALLIDNQLRQATTKQVQVFKFNVGECHLREFIAHPNCPQCRSREQDRFESARIDWQQRIKKSPVKFRESKELDTQSLKKKFYGQRSGLVRHLFDDPNSSLMPMACASFIQDGSVGVFENGYGRTNTKRQSKIVALLEALERFCGFMPRGRRTAIRGCYRQFREQAIDPRDFILHDREQWDEPGFSYPPYSDELEFNWVYGFSFRRKEPVLVPEQLVYYRLPDPEDRPANRFVYEVSNGCAMGGSIEEATLHGLFEVIERDAFLCNWYRQQTPVELSLRDASNPDIHFLLARSEAQGYKLHAFDIGTGFGVHCIWAMILNPAEKAPVKAYCAAGASIDPEQAIHSALVEVCTSITVYEKKLPELREKAASMVRQAELVQTMEDHVLLYSHDAAFSRFDFLFSDRPPTPLRIRFADWYRSNGTTDLLEDLTRVVDLTLNVASDVIVVDQSFDETRDSDLHCVKVLAPGLLPVTFGHQHRRIGLERLNAGLPSNHPRYMKNSINQYPHNFP